MFMIAVRLLKVILILPLILPLKVIYKGYRSLIKAYLLLLSQQNIFTTNILVEHTVQCKYYSFLDNEIFNYISCRLRVSCSHPVRIFSESQSNMQDERMFNKRKKIKRIFRFIFKFIFFYYILSFKLKNVLFYADSLAHSLQITNIDRVSTYTAYILVYTVLQCMTCI